MMTAAEQLAFYEEGAEASYAWIASFRAAQRWINAASNYSDAARCHFMRALIGWRTGLIDPVADLKATVEVSEEAVSMIRSTDVGVARYMLDPGPGAFSAILLDRLTGPIIDEAGREPPPLPRQSLLRRDTVIEASLISVLTGGPVGEGAFLAASAAKAKRTALYGETYQAYFELAAVPIGEPRAAWSQTSRLVALFAKRRHNGYIGGGLDHLGGDLNNDRVVDYHLAAIWRTRGWDPSGLPPAERLHALRPAS